MTTQLDVRPAPLPDFAVTTDDGDRPCVCLENQVPCTRQAVYLVEIDRGGCECSPVTEYEACIRHAELAQTFRLSCTNCDAYISFVQVIPL